MTTFWLLCALLSVLALAILLWPLIRPERDGFAKRASSLRDQLQLLEQTVKDGLLSEEQAHPRREALRQQLLAALDAPVGSPPSRRPLALILVCALSVPLAATVFYRNFGTPNAVAFAPVQAVRDAGRDNAGHAGSASATAGAGTDESAPDLRQAVEGLAERMKDKRDDIEGQLLLARTWRELAEFTKARDAYALVMAKRSDDPDLLAEYAESYGLAQEPRSLLGKPTELLDQALKLSPTHQRALWLRGFAYRQSGDLEKALTTWDTVLKQLPPEAPITSALIEQINVVRGELGQAPMAMPAVAPSGGTGLPENTGELEAPDSSTAVATDAATPNAATEGSAVPGVTVRVELDPSLASRLGPNDVLFVFARADQGPPMPLAIQRLPARDFPLTVSLSDANAMSPGMTLSMFPKVKIGARVSKTGEALAKPGDIQGFSEVISQPHSDVVSVRISEVVP